MWNLAQSLGLKTIFLRYNPDVYRNISGQAKYTSEATRYKILDRWLTSCKTLEITTDTPFLSAAYIFYDDFEIENTFMIEDLESTLEDLLE